MGQAAKLEIPRKLSDLTPEWLTRALRSSGTIALANVVGVEREPLGVGEGFIGELERLHLRYDIAEPGAPATVIAKLPTPVTKNRLLGEMIGAYEREVFFYTELAANFPSRVPRAYYADMDPNPLSKHSPKIIAWMDRRPRWFIAIMLLLTLLIVRISRRRYALLLEDMAPAQPGDQVLGASPERCREALLQLATMQAEFWQSPRLDAHFWLVRQDIAVNALDFMYRRSRPDFEKRYVERHPCLKSYLAWLDEHAEELTLNFHRSSPHTLLHMDYRLDNLFFGEGDDTTEGGEAGEITIFDWQTVARGPGIYDVAYFICGALTEDHGPEAERELVVAYHAAITAAGVRDYPLEQCLFDYQRSLMLILYRLATVEMVDFGEQRGQLLIDGWVDRLCARVVGVDLEKLI